MIATKPAFLTAQWRYLALLNFEVGRQVLEPLCPKGTELDERDGRYFMSLVGFLFLDTHVLSLPAFFHQDFEEVNLRFYVRREVGGELRRGVVFIRELVPLPLVSAMARLTYNEPYRTVPMQHSILDTNGELQSVEYLFGGPIDQCRMTLHVDSPVVALAPGSHEEFLSHREWGYTTQRDGGTIEYRVDHRRWNVWPNARWELDGPLGEFYDEPLAAILRAGPSSAFIADGSPIAVHLPDRIA
ncbi:MAG TPA: DUF2071 domain-containing protein [Gemmatimonadaceae bacterium]|nr:DUF2071 domain-containing protein [Gemmatimonadaceae bacterium]